MLNLRCWWVIYKRRMVSSGNLGFRRELEYVDIYLEDIDK